MVNNVSIFSRYVKYFKYILRQGCISTRLLAKMRKSLHYQPQSFTILTAENMIRKIQRCGGVIQFQKTKDWTRIIGSLAKEDAVIIN